jgi:hypothetical protein
MAPAWKAALCRLTPCRSKPRLGPSDVPGKGGALDSIALRGIPTRRRWPHDRKPARPAGRAHDRRPFSDRSSVAIERSIADP